MIANFSPHLALFGELAQSRLAADVDDVDLAAQEVPTHAPRPARRPRWGDLPATR